MQNTRFDESQTGIKIRYADDTTLMATSEEELKSLLMIMKEESEKNWLKTNSTFKKQGSCHPVPSPHGN